MRTAKHRRLDRIGKAMDALPLRTSVVRESFDHFRETGELPEDQRLADAVARTALNGGVPPVQPALMSPLERMLGCPVTVTVVTDEQRRSPPATTVREALLHDAVYETGVPRRSARAALMWLVDGGEDVLHPQFAASHGLPKFGCIGMHVFGWPRLLTKPPYVDQAHRLFARLESLTGRVDYSNPDWFEPISKATLRFWDTGQFPENELVRDLMLALEELELLGAHRKGVNVAKKMAALDRVATTTGAEREEALAALGAKYRPRRQRPKIAKEEP